ncbi:AT-rich interactive domain-containing protein 2 [Heracleum sosnowskyi]|uniref:AT-rich interactive domain-containing protein 2 n=1 Tax=Heracleum sosnowskyi TaxID=360622 RepID=A0AAD8ML75_9APIA|nr:AT-rich interactive domain-containing protein 2 [Heracleum sosnowskyi]
MVVMTYKAVFHNGLWDFVVQEFGLSSAFGTSLKLVYDKYLDLVDIWMQRTVKGKEGDSEADQRVFIMDLESETREFSSENTVEKGKDGRQVQVELEERSKSNFTSAEKLGERGKDLSFMDLDAGKDNGSDMLYESSVVSEGDSSRNQYQNNEARSLVQLNRFDGNNAAVDKCEIGSKSQDNDDACNRKRKRECISKSLNWIRKVAKDPCDQVIGSLPELSKWKFFGTEYPWKQLLLVRQAMMVQRHGNSKVESIWQLFRFTNLNSVKLNKQRMHPAMYEDRSRFSERVASSKMSQSALSFEKPQAQSCSNSTSSDTKSDLEKSLAGLWLTKYRHKKIPVGIASQAEVPEWTENVSGSESKWLGTCIWPQEIGGNRNCLIERDPTGLGRPDQCNCEFKGSFECVRLHVSENRIRLKVELGVAFYNWHIDKMGEEVALSWNKSEESKFEAIVRSNPPSQDNCFWEELCKHFHYKRREHVLSYYFNVFLLRRRGLQNRSTPVEIGSDDEDLEFETTTNCSGQTAVRTLKPSDC